MKPLLTLLILAVTSPHCPGSDKVSTFLTQAMLIRSPAIQKAVAPRVLPTGFDRYPWKIGIIATVFWVGEHPAENNPTPNYASSWDTRWEINYGGYDNPTPSARKNFAPKDFVPLQNPFYIALPYNDVTSGKNKPESLKAIPWFEQAFEKPGKSVCKGRWVAVRHKGRIAYAQWEDCGPFRTNHWAYVFGNERPRENRNQSAGLDISPSVRDYLGMDNKGITDWKFVDASDVPPGPWTKYGDNNTSVLQVRGKDLLAVDRNNVSDTQ